MNAMIDELRESIDEIDLEIVRSLAKRKEITSKILEAKNDADLKLRSEDREAKLLSKVVAVGKQLGLDSHYVANIFYEILDDSLRQQFKSLSLKNCQDLVEVAYHGVSGSYCELAADRFFSKKKIIKKGYKTFDDILEAIADGSVKYGILPVENTLTGDISEVMEPLTRSNLKIVGEEKLRIEHLLLSTEPCELGSIKKVYCSSLAYRDCRNFITRLGCEIEFVDDSARAAQIVSERKKTGEVALAGVQAKELYNLSEVARDIANSSENFIRYLVVSKTEEPVDLRIPAKTAVMIGTNQVAGSLVDCLVVFKQRNINLTKIENRPVPNDPWQEMFYIEFEGNVLNDEVKNCLQELSRCSKFVKMMGSFPSYDVVRTAISQQQDAASATTASATPKKAEKTGKKVSYKLASIDNKETTVIDIRGVKIGGDNDYCVIAGPCSVESEEQIMECAKFAKECGAKMLRGGCYKPRTSPYSFQGMGVEGLKLLNRAGKLYDLPVVTEVMASEDVEVVSEYADVLQIGARNMQNFNLLKAVGTSIRPVLLKRGLSSSLEDLLNAAEYILAHGNQQVILCERGIRTFETATRSTLDISAVPVLKRITHLPIIIDPSHAAGERDLVPPLCYAAKAVGAHGMIVEFHPNPEQALSDGPQALLFPMLKEVMEHLDKVAS